MMKVALLTGGPQNCIPPIIFNDHYQNWCGIDYGAVELVHHGIDPFLAIGDFDTASSAELMEVKQHCQKLIYRPLKDDITDTELALRYLITHYDCEEFKLYGATGGRLDQLFANIFFILKPQYHQYVEKIELIDKWNQVNFYLPGKHVVTRNPLMKYLAFIPLVAVKGLELLDEKYQLAKTDISYPVSLSSNEFKGSTAIFNFSKGLVMVIQSRD